MATHRTALAHSPPRLKSARPIERKFHDVSSSHSFITLPFRAADPSPFSRGRDPAARREAIERAAYFLAERRGFTPGHELEDWLRAEQEVDARRCLAES